MLLLDSFLWWKSMIILIAISRVFFEMLIFLTVPLTFNLSSRKGVNPMKDIVYALLAFSVYSNIFLWFQVWYLKKAHFEFEKIVLKWLAILAEQISDNRANDACDDSEPEM